MAAFSNAFAGTLVLDDIPAIAENAHIKSLPALAHAMDAPPDTTVSGRPITSLTLAINYALSSVEIRDALAPPRSRDSDIYRARFAENLRGYHAMNLGVHICAGLALFGVLRRTFKSAPLADRFDRAAMPLAFATSLLWLVHPLQTASVTYVIQRAEALMGLFLLLTLYCGVRANGSAARGWAVGAVAACALGMGSKEAMAAAPLLVVAWDWLFAQRRDEPFHSTWKRRWRLYAGLAATWVILAWNVWDEPRPGSVGFGFEGWPWWRYLATQAGVILHYLRLSFVPSPLVLDYGWPAVPSVAAALPQVAVVAALVILTTIATIRRHPAAFGGLLFFLVLAPSSSVLPIVTEVAAEHRMYLPLAGVLSLTVVGAFLAGQRAHLSRPVGFGAVALTASLFGALTYARNADYTSEQRMWEDTIEKRPSNPRAHTNYGVVLLADGGFMEAEPHLRKALQLKPDDAEANVALGAALCSTGRCDAGLTYLRRAAELDRGDRNALRNLAEAHASLGQNRDAAAYFRQAVALMPDDVFLLNQAGWLLATTPEDDVRDGQAALAMAERAVRITSRRDPTSLDTLAVAYAELNRFAEARAVIQEALAAARTRNEHALEAELQRHLAIFESGRSIRTGR